MGSTNPMTLRPTWALCVLALALSACTDTGFGQPCDIPQTADFRLACDNAEDTAMASGEDQPPRSSLATCAITDFAGCSTRVCLVYRGSSAFCSETCVSDADCEGSAACRPKIGDLADDPTLCEQVDCFCVRKADKDR